MKLDQVCLDIIKRAKDDENESSKEGNRDRLKFFRGEDGDALYVSTFED
jgi:hypothetical protein